MDRREALSWIGAGTAGVVFAGGNSLQAQEHEAHPMAEHLKTLGECIRACNQTAHHCLQILMKESAEHRDVHARAVALATDCQAFCVLAATLDARSSPIAEFANAACAEACRCCAETCEQGPGEVMKECAARCRDCERACRSMTKSTDAHHKSTS